MLLVVLAEEAERSGPSFPPEVVGREVPSRQDVDVEPCLADRKVVPEVPAFVRMSCCVDDTARQAGSKKVSFIVMGAGAPWDAETSAHSVRSSAGVGDGPPTGLSRASSRGGGGRSSHADPMRPR